jgi:hypothetical protein
MPSLEDIFSSENLAKLTEGGFESPLMTIGAQLLARSGGNPGATGQALVGAQKQITDQADSKELREYRRSIMANNRAQLEASQAKATEAANFKQNLQNPEFVAQLPAQIQGFVKAGAPADAIMDLWGKAQDIQAKQQQMENTQAYRQQQLGLQQQGQSQSAAQFDRRLAVDQAQQNRAKVPTPGQIIEEPLPDGKFQKQMFDPSTGGYKPYGAPFQKSQDALSLLLGGAGGPAVPDGPATGGNPAITSTVNQLTPAPTTAPMVTGGSMANAAAASQSAPVQVRSAVDYAKVPSGAQYLTPEGKLKVKP